ncbi:MAG: hypothetical protein ACOCWQ_03415 [Nanoarchaeota archaeon]
MLHVRKANIRDLSEIHAIDTFGKQLAAYSPLDALADSSEQDYGYYQNYVDGNERWCLVAEEDGIVGFILF